MSSRSDSESATSGRRPVKRTKRRQTASSGDFDDHSQRSRPGRMETMKVSKRSDPSAGGASSPSGTSKRSGCERKRKERRENRGANEDEIDGALAECKSPSSNGRDKRRYKSGSSKGKRRDCSGEDMEDKEHRRVVTAMKGLLEEVENGHVEDVTAGIVVRTLCERLQLRDEEREGLVFYHARHLKCDLVLGSTSTNETRGNTTRRQVPGLSTACSAVAGIVAPFSASMGTLASMGNGSTKLRGPILDNPVVGAAYKLVLHDNGGQNEEDVRSQFLSTFSRSARTAKSKTAVAHRFEMGQLFPDILETYLSTTRTTGPMLKNLDGDLIEAMLLVPDERWMSIASRGLAFVLEQHQRSLQAMEDRRPLTILGLIRGNEGANQLPKYTGKVMHEVGREIISKFVEWVNILDHLGKPPTPESLRRLVKEFVSERQSSEKGKKDTDANGEGGTGLKVSWDVKEQGKTLRRGFNDKLFECMNDAFGGTKGSAVNMLKMTNDIDRINAVLRPYLVPSDEDSERSSNTVHEGMRNLEANKGGTEDPLVGGDDGKNQDAGDGKEAADEEDAGDHRDSGSEEDERGSMNDGKEKWTGDGIHDRHRKKEGEEASAEDDDEEESSE